jgi:hypothetical protein
MLFGVTVLLYFTRIFYLETTANEYLVAGEQQLCLNELKTGQSKTIFALFK